MLDADIRLITSPTDVEGLVLRQVLGIDTETTGLGRKARLVSLQVADDEQLIVLDARRVSPVVLLSRALGKDWIFQNGKFDLWHLMPFLDEITGYEPWKAWKTIWDTMLAEKVLAGGLPRGAGLADLAYRYARIRLDKGEQKAFVRRSDETDDEYERRLQEPFTQSQLEYMVGDVGLLHTIKLGQQYALEKNGLMPVANLEMDLMPVLADMERIGVRVNVPAVEEMVSELDSEIAIRERQLVDIFTPHVLEWRAERWDAREAQIRAYDERAEAKKVEIERFHTAAPYNTQGDRRRAINAEMGAWRKDNQRPPHIRFEDGPINPSSDEQMLVAFQHLGLELHSTRADVLEGLKLVVEDEEIASGIDLLLEFRHMTKLKGSTLEKILELVDEGDRLHPLINQMVRTGRMSMSEPNLQNVPVRTELGKRIRRAFIPGEGMLLVSGDYSQIELRVLAEDIYRRTGDRTMLDMFLRGEDVHGGTAAMMYEVPLETVMDDKHPNHKLRRDAKVINFGLIYGMTEVGMAHDLQCSRAEARAKRERHFAIHKGIHPWMGKVIAEAHSRGYATTMLGRRRYFPAMPDDLTPWEERSWVASIERRALNTPIQGTAADIMKMGLIENWRTIREMAYQNNVVHDEIVEEAPRDVAEDVAQLTQAAMESAGRRLLKVCPVVAEMEIGETWS